LTTINDNILKLLTLGKKRGGSASALPQFRHIVTLIHKNKQNQYL